MEKHEEDADAICEDYISTRFFEMNIPYWMNAKDERFQKSNLIRYICNGINDGYSSFVVTHTINHDLSDKDVWNFDQSKLNIAEIYKEYKPESLPIHKEFTKTVDIDKMQIFTRLHVEVNNSKIANQLMNTNGGSSNEKMSKILHTYDVISASTSDEKILENLIQKSDIDIISLDFCEFFKFFFNKKLLKQAIEKEIMFEIVYGKAISDPSTHRKNFMGKWADLIECTKGRNIIISCGSDETLLQRNPHDTMSLAKLLGIPQKLVRDTISSNWFKAIQRGRMRKSFKGVVDFVDEKVVDSNIDYKQAFDKSKGKKSLLDMEIDQESIED